MAKHDNKAFGSYIKMLRQRKGLSLKAVSEKINISVAYLSRLENGKRIYPSIEVLRKLSAALEISFMNLLQVSLSVDKSDSKDFLEIILNDNCTIAGKDVPLEVKVELIEIIKCIINDGWLDINYCNSYGKDLILRINYLNQLLKKVKY